MSRTARGKSPIWERNHFHAPRGDEMDRYRTKRYWYCESPQYRDREIDPFSGRVIYGKKKTMFCESGNFKSTYYAISHHGMGMCPECKIVTEEERDLLITVLTLKGAKRYQMKNFAGWKKTIMVER